MKDLRRAPIEVSPNFDSFHLKKMDVATMAYGKSFGPQIGTARGRAAPLEGRRRPVMPTHGQAIVASHPKSIATSVITTGFWGFPRELSRG